MLIVFINITRLTSNEIFSPSNKIHGEVGRAKDLSAPLYRIIMEVRKCTEPFLLPTDAHNVKKRRVN